MEHGLRYAYSDDTDLVLCILFPTSNHLRDLRLDDPKFPHTRVCGRESWVDSMAPRCPDGHNPDSRLCLRCTITCVLCHLIPLSGILTFDSPSLPAAHRT